MNKLRVASMIMIIIFILTLIIFKSLYGTSENKRNKTFLKKFDDDQDFWEQYTINEEYKKPVTDAEYAETCDVFVVGVVKNAELVIERNLRRLSNFLQLFPLCKFFIYENNSTDKTKQYIKEWSKKSPANYCSLNDNDKINNIPKRLIRMQRVRAECHKWVTTLFSDPPEYVFIIDLDFLVGPRFDTLEYFFNVKEEWDAQFANGCSIEKFKKGKYLYYDRLALEYTNGDHYENKNPSFIPFQTGHTFKVNSAFGGLALYKGNVWYEGNYINNEGENECEHITFHHSLKEKGYHNLFQNTRVLLVR